jgi:hypothetical protein
MACCCNDGDSADLAGTESGAAHRRWLRGIGAAMEWALPITTLALIPKCPGCVAAYVLLFTGIGLSLPAAATVRWTIIALSVAALAYLILRIARRALIPAG